MFANAPKVMQAWAKSVNDRGGINGHPVKLLVADDNSDPAQQRSLVQEMVEKHGVIAFVGNYNSSTGQASADYLNQKRVPAIGGTIYDTWNAKSPMHFSHGAPYSGFHFGTVGAVASVANGKTKVGTLVCTEAASCTVAANFYEQFAPTFGMNVVYKATGSIAQPDFTAECLSARNAGVEIFMIGMDGNTTRRIAASCARQGFHPIYSLPSTGVQRSMDKDPNLNGLVAGSSVYPWFLTGVPGAAEFAANMKKYLPDLDYGGPEFDAWVSAKLFEAAATRMQGPPSSAALLDALWSLRGETLGGLTQPLTFQRDKPNALRRCWFNQEIKDGAWFSPDNGKLNCRD